MLAFTPPAVKLCNAHAETHIEIVITSFNVFLFDRIRTQIGISSWLNCMYLQAPSSCTLSFFHTVKQIHGH